MQFGKIFILIAGLTCSGLSASAQADDAKKAKGSGKGSTSAAPKGMKARHLNGEATLKSKDQSKVDFEAADIGGERKAPLGTLINQNKADKNYDFVKIRLRWHPEMVQSASALDNGASK
ncbi:MAG: hypothetical protein NTZ90_07800 [Proteobacteria bacterium]|nr:hypothetical protein [Pseudomonadota bacterium]